MVGVEHVVPLQTRHYSLEIVSTRLVSSILVPRASGESYVISDVMCSRLLQCSCVLVCRLWSRRRASRDLSLSPWLAVTCRARRLCLLGDSVHAAFSRWQQMRGRL